MGGDAVLGPPDFITTYLIWSSCKALKAYRQRPDARFATGFDVRFDRIFVIRTGYGDYDKLQSRRKAELLRVRECPEIPLCTNALENDLRSFVIHVRSRAIR
jgi:hypothetical protein